MPDQAQYPPMDSYNWPSVSTGVGSYSVVASSPIGISNNGPFSSQQTLGMVQNLPTTYSVPLNLHSPNGGVPEPSGNELLVHCSGSSNNSNYDRNYSSPPFRYLTKPNIYLVPCSTEPDPPKPKGKGRPKKSQKQQPLPPYEEVIPNRRQREILQQQPFAFGPPPPPPYTPFPGQNGYNNINNSSLALALLSPTPNNHNQNSTTENALNLSTSPLPSSNTSLECTFNNSEFRPDTWRSISNKLSPQMNKGINQVPSPKRTSSYGEIYTPAPPLKSKPLIPISKIDLSPSLQNVTLLGPGPVMNSLHLHLGMDKPPASSTGRKSGRERKTKNVKIKEEPPIVSELKSIKKRRQRKTDVNDTNKRPRNPKSRKSLKVEVQDICNQNSASTQVGNGTQNVIPGPDYESDRLVPNEPSICPEQEKFYQAFHKSIALNSDPSQRAAKLAKIAELNSLFERRALQVTPWETRPQLALPSTSTTSSELTTSDSPTKPTRKSSQSQEITPKSQQATSLLHSWVPQFEFAKNKQEKVLKFSKAGATKSDTLSGKRRKKFQSFTNKSLESREKLPALTQPVNSRAKRTPKVKEMKLTLIRETPKPKPEIKKEPLHQKNINNGNATDIAIPTTTNNFEDGLSTSTNLSKNEGRQIIRKAYKVGRCGKLILIQELPPLLLQAEKIVSGPGLNNEFNEVSVSAATIQDQAAESSSRQSERQQVGLRVKEKMRKVLNKKKALKPKRKQKLNNCVVKLDDLKHQYVNPIPLPGIARKCQKNVSKIKTQYVKKRPTPLLENNVSKIKPQFKTPPVPLLLPENDVASTSQNKAKIKVKEAKTKEGKTRDYRLWTYSPEELTSLYRHNAFVIKKSDLGSAKSPEPKQPMYNIYRILFDNVKDRVILQTYKPKEYAEQDRVLHLGTKEFYEHTNKIDTAFQDEYQPVYFEVCFGEAEQPVAVQVFWRPRILPVLNYVFTMRPLFKHYKNVLKILTCQVLFMKEIQSILDADETDRRKESLSIITNIIEELSSKLWSEERWNPETIETIKLWPRITSSQKDVPKGFCNVCIPSFNRVCTRKGFLSGYPYDRVHHNALGVYPEKLEEIKMCYMCCQVVTAAHRVYHLKNDILGCILEVYIDHKMKADTLDPPLKTTHDIYEHILNYGKGRWAFELFIDFCIIIGEGHKTLQRIHQETSWEKQGRKKQAKSSS